VAGSGDHVTPHPTGHGGSEGDELLAALFELSRAQTLAHCLCEALPPPLQVYGTDMCQLLDHATACLRVHLASLSAPPAHEPGEQS
jgi:hypothetical protein